MLQEKDKVADLILQGKTLLLAGDQRLLDTLPKGNWIAGTIPYFMDKEGGKTTRDYIFVQEISHTLASIRRYPPEALPRLLTEAPDNGYTILIIPAGSRSHVEYATNAPDYRDMFVKPVIGWISGVHLDDLATSSALVYNGKDGTHYGDDAIAMHLSLPPGKTAKISIINLFKQGSGPAITFPKEGFSCGECAVDGRSMNLAEYIRDNSIDTKLPLVANYSGAMINVSIQEVKDTKVVFYAPVFKDVEYRFARPLTDYVADFGKALPVNVEPVFACNCILNYLYSGLEGKKTEKMEGPVTFGEIAYQLLNQTLVYLEVV